MELNNIMLGTISNVSIIVSAILAIAVASVWYSPLFFGRILSKTTGHIFDDTDESRSVLLKQVIVGVLAQLLFLIFVAQFILQSGAETEALLRVGIPLAGLVVATLLTVVVIERRSVIYFLVHAGYMMIVLFGGLAVIAKWPW